MADQPAGGDSAAPLDMTAALAAADVAEVLGVTISHVPEGATLSAGADAGGGTWTLSAAELDGLSITPPPGRREAIRLTVVAAAREAVGDTARPTTVAFGLTVPVTEPPAAAPEPESRAPTPVTADDENAIPLDIDTGLMAMAGSETVGVSLSGVPEGAALSAGTDNGDGTWTLEPADLDGLAIRLPADAGGFFILGIAAFAADGSIATGSIRVDAEEPPEQEIAREAEPGPEREPAPDIVPGPDIVTGPEAEIAAPEPELGPEPRPEPELGPEPVPEPAPAPGPIDAAAGTGPVAYWKLDEPAPGAVRDEMGAHPGLIQGVGGGDGGAFDAVAAFNGTSDVIEVADAAALNPAAGTLTVWVNAFASAYGVIAAKGGLRLGVRSGGLEFELASADGTQRAQGGALGVNEWNQATVTWGDAGMKVYLNGELVAADDHPGGLDAAGHPWLFGAAEADGADGVGFGDFFHGELDDIALYGHPMTAAEVQDLCHLGVEGLIEGKTVADIDSGLDFGAIPAELEGPESLATVDERRGEPGGPPAPAAPGEPAAPAASLDLAAADDDPVVPEIDTEIDTVIGAGDDDPVVPEFDAPALAAEDSSDEGDDPVVPEIDTEIDNEIDTEIDTEIDAVISAGDDDPVVPEFDAAALNAAEDSFDEGDDPVVPEFDAAGKIDEAVAAAEPDLPAADVAAGSRDGEDGEVFPDDEGWSETVSLDEDADPASGDADTAAVTLAEDGELSLEGGEKLEW